MPLLLAINQDNCFLLVVRGMIRCCLKSPTLVLCHFSRYYGVNGTVFLVIWYIRHIDYAGCL